MFLCLLHFEIQLVCEANTKAAKWLKYFKVNSFAALSVIVHYDKENSGFLC